MCHARCIGNVRAGVHLHWIFAKRQAKLGSERLQERSQNLMGMFPTVVKGFPSCLAGTIQFVSSGIVPGLTSVGVCGVNVRFRAARAKSRERNAFNFTLLLFTHTGNPGGI